MILIVLFMSDFSLPVVNFQKAKHLEKDQSRCILKTGNIFACQKTRAKK